MIKKFILIKKKDKNIKARNLKSCFIFLLEYFLYKILLADYYLSL